jgi:hypothetical protein
MSMRFLISTGSCEISFRFAGADVVSSSEDSPCAEFPSASDASELASSPSKSPPERMADLYAADMINVV